MKTTISKVLLNNLIARADLVYKKEGTKEEKKALVDRINRDYNNSDSDGLFIDTVESNYRSLIYTSDKIMSLRADQNNAHIKGDVSTVTVWIIIWGIASIIGFIGAVISVLS